ncbi:MAG: hypothetical protein KGL39_45095 [Patescibacteria group bacterium]|nr:hypothetical protein [Patescibacteria group bacterium]
MKTPKEIRSWLIANLGPRALAPLSSHDWNALLASVALTPLISHESAPPRLFTAYANIVMEMQEHTRWLAFHAIAMELDWGHRFMIWEQSNHHRDFEQPLMPPTSLCCFESGGGGQERYEQLRKQK